MRVYFDPDDLDILLAIFIIKRQYPKSIVRTITTKKVDTTKGGLFLLCKEHNIIGNGLVLSKYKDPSLKISFKIWRAIYENSVIPEILYRRSFHKSPFKFSLIDKIQFVTFKDWLVPLKYATLANLSITAYNILKDHPARFGIIKTIEDDNYYIVSDSIDARIIANNPKGYAHLALLKCPSCGEPAKTLDRHNCHLI